MLYAGMDAGRRQRFIEQIAEIRLERNEFHGE
jgi:hypothetical protein